MASVLRKRVNKKLPRAMTELISRVNTHGDSFVRAFDDKEPRMTQIAEEFEEIATKVKKMLGKSGELTLGGLGAAIGIIAAPFTGGMSLALAAGSVATATGVYLLIKNHLMAEDSAKLESLRKNVMEITEPMMKDLKEIKVSCDKLEQNPSDFKDMEEFQRLHDKVKTVSVFVFDQTEGLMVFIDEMQMLILNIIKLSQEESKTLTGMIVKSGDECKKLIQEFADVKEELQAFKLKTAVSKKCSIL